MRLSVQITLVTTAVALFTTITASVVAYRGAHASAVDRALAAAEARGRLVAQQLETRLRALRADAISLREGAAIATMLTTPPTLSTTLSTEPAAPGGGWSERLARDFAARLRASPSYLRIRLLDERGRERLGLDRDAAGMPRRRPANALEDARTQRDFTAASRLDDGLVYLSTILPEADPGAEPAAIVPLLRAAAPLRASGGALAGALVIDLDLRPLVARLAGLDGVPFDLAITDAAGRCLLVPSRFDDAAASLGCTGRESAGPGIDAAANGRATQRDAAGALRYITVARTDVGAGPQMLIVQEAERATLVGSASGLTSTILRSAAVIVLFAVVIGMLLARSVVRPLERMSRAVAGFAGRGRLEAPTGGSTELLHLGRAFEQMAREIDQRTGELERDERRFRQLVEHSPVGTLVVDGDGRIVLSNSRAEVLFGYAPGELLGEPVDRLVPSDQREAHPALRRAYSARPTPRPMGGERELYAQRRDGSLFPVEVALNPLAEGDGAHIVASIVDITERKAAADFMHGALREKEVLLREIYHRVKNNLQTLSSLIALQQRRAPPGLPRELLRDSGARIHAMALAHEMLHRSDAVEDVDFAAYARELLRHIETVHGIDPTRIDIVCHSEPLRLDVDRSIPLGLILNELVVNSLKHAFPGARRGRIAVTLGHDAAHAWLTVSDDGVGCDVDLEPGAEHLGQTLVRSLVEQLDAELHVSGDAGTSVTIRMPLGTRTP